jgi:hypothetical protein
MARNSFVFYKSFFEAIKELEDEDKGIISYAIMQYGLTGEQPNLTGYLKSMFLLIKPQIDANNKKYESGCMGGRPLKVKGNHSETKRKPKDKQRETKAYPNEDVDVNEDVNENEDVDVNGNGDCKGKNQNDKKVLGEDPVKLESNKGKNGGNDETDFSFGEKRGTANDRTSNERTTNGGTEDERGIATPEGTKSQWTKSQSLENPSAELISSTSANTFKARVEYAKSLGIEESVARMICNFAQSKKFALFETHYAGFVGKSEKEVEEAFSVLKLVAERGKKANAGLKRINTS